MKSKKVVSWIAVISLVTTLGCLPKDIKEYKATADAMGNYVVSVQFAVKGLEKPDDWKSFLPVACLKEELKCFANSTDVTEEILNDTELDDCDEEALDKVMECLPKCECRSGFEKCSLLPIEDGKKASFSCEVTEWIEGEKDFIMVLNIENTKKQKNPELKDITAGVSPILSAKALGIEVPKIEVPEDEEEKFPSYNPRFGSTTYTPKSTGGGGCSITTSPTAINTLAYFPLLIGAALIGIRRLFITSQKNR